MVKHAIKRVPIVDGGRVIGIVSRSDLLRVIVLKKNSPHGPVDDDSLGRAVRARLGTDLGLDATTVQVSVKDAAPS